MCIIIQYTVKRPAIMFLIQETGVEMELEENMPLLEWLANNYKKFGAGLEIITDRSQVRQLL